MTDYRMTGGYMQQRRREETTINAQGYLTVLMRPKELAALDQMVTAYLTCLPTTMPASAERDRLMQALRCLQERWRASCPPIPLLPYL
jgi:hypothetical protein